MQEMEYPQGFDSSVHARKPICGVLAVALCAGVSYNVAHATLKQIAYEGGAKRFGGRTQGDWQRKALSRLGVRYTHSHVKGNMTVKRFIEEIADPYTTYLLQVRGHVVTYRNGIITDQAKQEYYLACRTSRRQLITYTRIDGKGW